MPQKKGFHVTYNAPVTLTFSLIAALVLLLDIKVFQRHLVPAVFAAPGCQGSGFAFNWKSPFDYVRLFTHILGHSDWNHLLSNLSFILLLGPILEERYGSGMITIMILITALVNGVLNACFIASPLTGSSGIAFMMILLASATNISRNELPLSFLLILALYLGRELFSPNHEANIATFAHVAGGICGSMFGFLVVPGRRASGPEKTSGVRNRKIPPDHKGQPD